MRRALCLLALPLAACLCGAPPALGAPPPIRHVFVIVLENKNFDETFGPATKAPYLAKTLVSKGQLLTQYYGIGHESLDNYIAMVSGQSPNPQTQADCQVYTEFLPGTIGPDGQALGTGCAYPSAVKTVADQLEGKGLRWKGYMEDMKTPCEHPAIGAPDQTQTASAQNQYAARHNPFVYFHSLTDRPTCAQNDVPLDRLQGDLASTTTTPNYVFITPDLCHDGHDEPCKGINEPGGLVSADAFLQTWVPRILASPAYKKNGMLIVTFDESDSGAEACCNEPTGPNTPNNGGPMPGAGGGRTGTVILSKYVRPGVANDTPYNHYSLLRSIEDLFGLSHLGYAGRPGLKAFGSDVYNAAIVGPPVVGPPTIRIRGVPRRRCTRGFRARVRISARGLKLARVLIDRRTIARKHAKRFTVRVNARRLRRGRHRFVVRVTQHGASGTASVRFSACGSGAPAFVG